LGGSRFKASPSKQFETPSQKYNQSKMDWCGLRADCLLCKYKAMNSNPSPTKKKKLKKENNAFDI
jgi:hypothetical protein